MSKPIAKLLDYKHCNLGDSMTNEVIVEKLMAFGYAVCGGDIKELEACKDIEPDIIVVGGGGQIYETPSMSDGALYGDRGLLELSRKYPVYFVGTGFNGFWHPEKFEEGALKQLKQDWREVLNRAESVSLRDEGSINACKKIIGADIDDRYSHFPCPAFAIKDKIVPLSSKNDKLAIYSVQALEKRKELEEKIVRTLRNQKYRIIFMPHCSADVDAYRERAYGERENEELVEAKESPIAALQIMQQASLHVTSRLHGLVASIVTGTPMLHIGKDQDKIKWAIQEISLKNYPFTYDWKNAPDKEMVSAIKKIAKQRSKITEQFLEIAKEASEEALKHLGAITTKSFGEKHV